MSWERLDAEILEPLAQNEKDWTILFSETANTFYYMHVWRELQNVDLKRRST